MPLGIVLEAGPVLLHSQTSTYSVVIQHSLGVPQNPVQPAALQEKTTTIQSRHEKVGLSQALLNPLQIRSAFAQLQVCICKNQTVFLDQIFQHHNSISSLEPRPYSGFELECVKSTTER